METPLQILEEIPEKQIQIEPEKPQLKDGYSFTDKKVGMVPVIRDARVKLKTDKQLKLYSPCSCGSGKKFKFCCNGKQMVIINTGG